MSLIALDIDNTLADFDGGFARYLSRQPEFATRKFPTHKVYDLVQSGWFSDYGQFRSHFASAETAGLYLNLTMFRGAVEALHALSAKGHRFVIATARSASYYGDTLQWATSFGFPFEGIVHTEVKTTVQADLYIEDADYQLTSLVRAGRTVLAHDRPYNRGLSVPRFTDWADVPALVEGLLT